MVTQVWQVSNWYEVIAFPLSSINETEARFWSEQYWLPLPLDRQPLSAISSYSKYTDKPINMKFWQNCANLRSSDMLEILAMKIRYFSHSDGDSEDISNPCDVCKASAKNEIRDR